MPQRKAPIFWPALLWTFGIFAVLSAYLAIASKGFMEADGITHYNARRFALTDPLHLVGVWSRPFCVALYMVPAHFGGLIGTRLTSLVLALITAWITCRVAQRQNYKYPELAATLLCCMPLWFVHSFSELTEIPFAMLLISAFYCYQRKWFAGMMLILTFAPLARPEGFGFLALGVLVTLLHRRWLALLIAPVGWVCWNVTGWLAYGMPTDLPWYKWLSSNWPYSQVSAYGSGRITRFIEILPAVIGPITFPFMLGGIWLIGKVVLCRKALFPHPSDLPEGEGIDTESAEQSSTSNFDRHRTICNALIIAIPLMILVGHSFLWFMGKMASNGEPRYMLVVAPFWALLAAKGWTAFFDRYQLKHIFLSTLICTIPPIAMNIYYPCFPIGMTVGDELAGKVAKYIHDNPELLKHYPKIAGSHPRLSIELNLNPLDRVHGEVICKRTATKPPPGVLMIWDPVFSQFNSDDQMIVSRELLEQNGWILHEVITHKNESSYIYLSPYKQ